MPLPKLESSSRRLRGPLPGGTLRPAVPVLAVLAWCLVGAAPAARAAGLQSVIDSAIFQADLGDDAVVGVAVVEPGRGRLIAGRNGDRAMIPASNMKLITTSSALITLGRDFEFETVIGELDGRLVIVGSGDPALGDAELLDQNEPPMTPDDLLGTIADAIIERGVSAPSEIVVDDRVFDREWVHPSWPREQLNMAYSAEVAGLNFHSNVISVSVRPASPGLVPVFATSPSAPWLDMENEARSVSEGRNTVWISRPHPRNRFTLFGKVRHPAIVDVAVHEPPAVTAALLAHALLSRGTPVGELSPGRRHYLSDELLGVVRMADDKEGFGELRPLAIVTSPLLPLLRRCNVESQNLYAEALLKRLGHESTGDRGSWESGAAVVRMLFAERLEPNDALSITIADGSGLSRDNRVSPSVLARWLASLADDEALSSDFLGTLPTVGEGTLSSRFGGRPLENELRAKTGYIRGVYALSGVVSSENGRSAAFSILCNDVKYGQGAAAKTLHEKIVEAIDEWVSGEL